MYGAISASAEDQMWGWAEFAFWLDQWQTLIAGVLALAGAVGTIFVLRHQMRQEAERHEALMKRKQFAARAAMPDALSALCRFTQDSMQYLDGRSSETPTPPSDAIATLKSVIEFIDDVPAEKTFELVSFYQVYCARLFARPLRRTDLVLTQLMYDTALLRHYTDRLFEYARNQKQTVDEPESMEKVTSALRNAVTLEYFFEHKDRYAKVVDLINRRHLAE